MQIFKDPITALLLDWMNLSEEQYRVLYKHLCREYLAFNKVKMPQKIFKEALFQAHWLNHVKRLNQVFFDRMHVDENTVLWYRTKPNSSQVISLTTPKEVEEQYLMLHYQTQKASWSMASLVNIIGLIKKSNP